MSLSSSSTRVTTSGTRHTDPSWHTGKDRGIVYVYVRHVEGWSYAHHFIVVDVPGSNKYVIYEWVNTGLEKFATKKFRGLRCLTLGEFSLDEVNHAAEKAANGKTYHFIEFNCNMWTDKVANVLGITIRVYYNCSEVTYVDRRNCHHGSVPSIPIAYIPPLAPIMVGMGVGRFIADQCGALIPFNEKK